MQVLDASSIIHAWDNYPINQFPGLWSWIGHQIEVRSLVIPRLALEEVSHKIPECQEWLIDKGIEQLEMTNAIIMDAMRIKVMLGITADTYHPKGVDENDLFIIASARAYDAELVSDESRQTQPVLPAKSKIPKVCAMSGVTVPCLNFLEYIKRSKMVFR
jgi:hypothetical protein